MSAPPESPPQAPEALEDLDFERTVPKSVEPGLDDGAAGVPGTSSCGVCNGALSVEYWASAAQTLCAACAQKVTLHNKGKAGFKGFMKASLFGTGAALLGCGIYYLVSLSGWAFGLIAIVVGYLVGHAVRVGSGGYGGRGFQFLALLLTYTSIAGTYTPHVVKGLLDEPDDSAETTSADHANGEAKNFARMPDETPRAASQNVDREPISATPLTYVFAFFISLALPFMMGTDNIMGLIILAIGLWEAWKINRRVQVELSGPYAISESAPDAASASLFGSPAEAPASTQL